MILLIDNYDSFSYNLYQYLGELAGGADAGRADALRGVPTADELGHHAPRGEDALRGVPTDDGMRNHAPRDAGTDEGVPHHVPGGTGASTSDGVRVVRNDCIDAAGVRELAPSHIIISPGPGYPADAGNCVDIVRELAGEIPILGVCLGHQAICEAFGANIVHARELMHGKQSTVSLDGSCALFAGLPEQVKVARYHSLAADEATLPASLKVVARADDGEVMAVEYADPAGGAGEHPVFGVQFHPESIMTPDGKAMLARFLERDT